MLISLVHEPIETWQLTVNVELDLVLFEILVYTGCGIKYLLLHLLEPSYILLSQISERPDVSPINDSKQMQACNSLAVPIEVRHE